MTTSTIANTPYFNRIRFDLLLRCPWWISISIACLLFIGGGIAQASDGGGQLVSYPAQRFAMEVCFPRPDSETGTFAAAVAKNRWAYYDGVNSLESSFAIQVFGGAPPLQYSLITAPPGTRIDNVYGDKFNHGVLRWTPQSAFPTTAPAVFTVRVTGQDGQYVDRSWTTATSSSTDQFIFVGPTDGPRPGNDANPGTHDLPFLTLAKVMGATTTQSTFPKRHVIMYGGSLATTAHLDAWNGGNSSETLPARIQLSRTLHPIVYSAYPGQSPSIDFSGGEITIVNGSDDAFFGGSGSTHTIIRGASVNAAETHNFWLWQVDRVNFQFLAFDGFHARIAGEYTNSAPIFTTSTASRRKYLGIHGCTERNRTGGRTGNDSALFVLFFVSYVCVEYNDTECLASTGPYFKDSHDHCSARHNRIHMLDGANGGGRALIFYGQTDGSDCEAFFNLVIGGAIDLNGQWLAGNARMFAARNTVIRSDTNGEAGIWAGAGAGPFTSEDDVIVSRGIGGVTSRLSSTSGAECHYAWNGASPPGPAPPCNVTTGALQDISGGTQYKTLYRGTKGWEMVVSGSPPANHAPVATAQSVSTTEDTAKAITLVGTDVDGQALTYAIVANPTHGTLSGSGASLTYTPAANYTGADSFTFKVNDGTLDSLAATVSLTVTAVNDPPVATAQSVSTTEDTAKAITLAGTDVEGQALTYAIVANPTHGTLTGNGASRTYTPAANYTGADSFTFKVNDGTLDSLAATVSLTVTAVNDRPVATAQSASTTEDTAKAITLAGTDVEGQALTYTIVANPTHGTLSGSGASRTYTPATGYTGGDSFTFTVNDGTATSSAATVTITVTAVVNTAPVVSAASATPSPVTGTTTWLSATATDNGGEPALVYTWSATGPALVAFSPNASNAAKATVATFNKAGSYTFTVTAKDTAGLTGTKTVALTVNATPTQLSISPTSASVKPLKTVDFNAIAEDQFGTTLAIQPSLAWTASGGGTIDANGLFTAGTGTPSPSGGIIATTYVVTATGGGQSATALVTVSTASTAMSGVGGCGGGAVGLVIGLGMMLALRRRR